VLPKSELFHTFKEFITYFYVVILSCVLVLRHDHILSLLSTYFYNNLLTNDYRSFCIFLYSIYTSTQHSNISSINHKPSWFACTFQTANSKAKLISNSDKSSHCFKPFFIGYISDMLASPDSSWFHLGTFF